MIDYTIEFTPDKARFLETIISAVDKTSAYLEFVRLFPKEYIITDMRAVRKKRGVEA